MAPRPLAIKLYLALQGRDRGHKAPINWPDPPQGTVIWAICGSAANDGQAQILETALQADGDQIHVVITRQDVGADVGSGVDRQEVSTAGQLPHPFGRRQTEAFIAQFRPQAVLWIGAKLDPALLDHLARLNIPSFVVAATAEITSLVDGAVVPRLTRATLGLVERIITLDVASAQALKAKGASLAQLATFGPIQASLSPLPHLEYERQDMANALGTRPIWLFAGADLGEVAMIAEAHFQASRRAHRLLLIVATRRLQDADAMADALRAKGFVVHTRADDTEPQDATQIFVADGMDELGLWYRIAPVTFLAGTMDTGAVRHPFEPASLGSAVLHGPHVAPYEQQAAQLAHKAGSLPVTSAAELGQAVETLLSADKVAKMAHAAWDVTTKGAGVAQKIATLIHARLDVRGGNDA